MGQVPGNTYCLIGNGRAAKHMAAYLSAKEIPFTQWFRASQDSFQNSVSPAQTVILLITDREIEPFINSRPELHEKTLIHFSGALSTPHAYGMHPLMTFTDEPYLLTTYEKISFVCDSNAPDFHSVFPTLNNPYYKIDPTQKALYHSLCVMSGNFTTLLWQTFFTRLERDFGLPSKIAKPYLEQITANLLAHPEAALTGPIARGDLTTIEKNLIALNGDSLKPIYEAFVKSFLPQQEQHS